MYWHLMNVLVVLTRAPLVEFAATLNVFMYREDFPKAVPSSPFRISLPRVCGMVMLVHHLVQGP